MPPLQPYGDLPGIDEDGFAFDPFRIGTLHMGVNTYWTSLDPALASMRQFEAYDNYQYTTHLQTMRERLNELEVFANGYVHPSPLQIPEQAFSRLDLHSHWSDQNAYKQLTLPNGAMVGTLSSTISTPSERAFSPEVVRYLPTWGPASYPSPTNELSYTGNYESWSQPQMYVGELASPCPSSHTSACNLKELQYAPDSTVEDDHLEDPDTIQVKINAPEEIVLSPAVISPVDSGIVIDDVSIKDEDDDIPLESDNDEEYIPSSAPRKQSMSTRRPVMRSPKRTRSIPNSAATTTTTTAVLDFKARISKPMQSKRPSKPSRPTAPKSTKDTAAKQFTCTFHHYGCLARFASKNEWKRHVASQHLQLGFYRCDVGRCDPKHKANGSAGSHRGYNDFNRKDLFTQHHRRMHTPWGNPKDGSKREWEEFEEGLEEVRRRCWKVRRDPPSRSGCGFCGKVFEDAQTVGEGEVKTGSSWEERMEHIGKHFERRDYGVVGGGMGDDVDEDLTRWAIEHDVVSECTGRGVWLVGSEPPVVVVVKKEAAGKRRSRRNTRDSHSEEEDDALHEEE